jgi:uncharacterized protein (TIGR03435 family)
MPGAVGGGPEPIVDREPMSVFTALREQLGVKLENARGPVDVVAIDSVEPPTPD